MADTNRRDAERSLATDILADYAADQPQVLADLLMDADEKQFAVDLSEVQGARRTGRAIADRRDRQQAATRCTGRGPRDAGEAAGECGGGPVADEADARGLAELKHSSDPRVRSYLIHRLSPFGVDAQTIIDRLDDESDITIRRALLLSLGEFDRDKLPLEKREALIPKLQELYRADPDAGLHAATEWLLRIWEQAPGSSGRMRPGRRIKNTAKNELDSLRQLVAHENDKASAHWYVNSQGQTMILLASPGEFVMGSPPSEAGRYANESQHTERIDRAYALSAHHVTVEQYRRFAEEYQPPAVQNRMENLPAVGISWYMAAAYCNWLSKNEEIPEDQWCYEIKAPEQVRLRANYPSLTGYRLPTEAEMEFATRAGADYQPLLWPDGRTAAEVRVVSKQLARAHLAGGQPEAQ